MEIMGMKLLFCDNEIQSDNCFRAALKAANGEVRLKE